MPLAAEMAFTYAFEIEDQEGKPIGILKADSAFIKGVPKKRSVPFSEVRKGFAQDSVGDSLMNVVMRYPLEPAS